MPPTLITAAADDDDTFPKEPLPTRIPTDLKEKPEQSDVVLEDPSKTYSSISKVGTLQDYPDGGFGWLVVFGAFMIQFCGFGFNFSWGVYQEYYLEAKTFPGATLSQVSWVGGIGASSVFLTTPFQASMTRLIGLRAMIASGALISGSGIILASFAKELWQLYLTQGVLFGLGAGMSIFTSIAVPVQWFDKRRGLASGICVAGSGIGGASLAPLSRYLISHVGYQWALRIIGLSTIVIVWSVMWCIRTRIPKSVSRHGTPLFDVGLFREPGFANIYVTDIINLDAKTGASLVGIFSGVNAASRILLGIAADSFGRFNVLALCTVLSGLSCFMFWLNTHSMTMAVVFVVIYGINGGGFVSLFPVVAAEVLGVEKLAAAVGLLYSGNFFGNLLGTPIASAIVTASGGSYTWAIIFAGTAPILGAVLLLMHRFKIEKRIFVKI
ncbi:hypothetical protein BG004_006794 [Podila humilis]|nr:hypothetical protein BG004_006794 [Podila humilis]